MTSPEDDMECRGLLIFEPSCWPDTLFAGILLNSLSTAGRSSQMRLFSLVILMGLGAAGDWQVDLNQVA